MKPTPNLRRPAKSILDRTFRYTPSHCTDVRETFERARRELQPGRPVNVVRLPTKETR
jgi:hypothetical protein